MPTTKYLWDDETDSVVMEKDGSGTTQAVYTTEPEPFGRLVSMRRNNKTYNYIYDGLGSTAALADENGQITDTYRYDAWGNERAKTGTTTNPYRFVGEQGYQYNEATQDYYVRERVYEPHIGRWGRFDSVPAIARSTDYSYAANSPTTLNDPSGMRISCRAKCVRYNDVGYGVHTMATPRGVRGGMISAVIQNSGSMFHSRMLASFELSDVRFINFWWEPEKDDVRSRSDCCCCCDRVPFAQVFVDTWDGTGEAKKYMQSIIAPVKPGVPYIDHALRYPGSRSLRPCSESRVPTFHPARKPGMKDAPPAIRYNYSDTPGINGGDLRKFIRMGGTTFQQRFFSCAYCDSGVEGYQRSKAGETFMVTYCCLEWGHKVFVDGGKVFVKRFISGRAPRISPLIGDDKSPGSRALFAHKCDPPTKEFKAGIKAGKVFLAEGKVVDLPTR